ncbi:MAG: antibiotic biosynthesis monooxygenase [Anaerolineae bacterium]|nr:MAG: antibiotic biosynthesis monooxygenase [Anaerolineae bacterium]
MYGLIGRMIAKEGKREELIKILLAGSSGMPGCLSYVVARDGSDPGGIWITEVWQDKEQHAASLSLPSVQAAIAAGRPMIESFSEHHETHPVGGHLL